MRRIIRLIPFLFFRLGLFAVWRLVPRPLRQLVVRKVVPQIPDRKHPLARPVEPVIVVGFLRSTTSLGWMARRVADAARSAGLKAYGLDVAGAVAADHLLASVDAMPSPPAEVIAEAATLVVCVNPDQFAYTAAFLPPAIFENKYVIGDCVWELERIPQTWLAPLALLDEIWVPSEFVRRAFVASGVSIPCRIVPSQLDPPASINPDRGRFGIPADAFVVLVAFSLRSGAVRKNPMAAVRAFRKAFADDSDVRLLFKISDVDVEGPAWGSFRGAVGDDPRFVFVTDFLSDRDMWSLFASIDVALSTHRAEGYGMIPAQAMQSGRAVIATGWSGNLDFMTADNAILLPYRLVPVSDVDERFVVEGTRWADVDEDAAAAALRRLYVDADFRSRLALAGKSSIEAYLAQRRNDLLAYMRSWRHSAKE